MDVELLIEAREEIFALEDWVHEGMTTEPLDRLLDEVLSTNPAAIKVMERLHKHKKEAEERERIANRERAEGAEYDLERRANADRTAIEIRTAAQRDAEIIKGCAEAESIKIYAGALSEDPEFYSFQRSLEAYKEYLDSNTTIIGSSADLGELFAKIRIGVNDASRIDTNNTDIDTSSLSDKSSFLSIPPLLS